MITSIADVSCTPIGPPLLKSRPPLQTQVSNTTNISVPDRGPLRFGVLAVTLLQGECRVVRASNPQHSVH
ncbi:hypothetical protein TNCV_245291 [Trichonephila clavipes]|nr:hypothetical protein TNCV_245291 [Trichonephila clavipes]